MNRNLILTLIAILVFDGCAGGFSRTTTATTGQSSGTGTGSGTGSTGSSSFLGNANTPGAASAAQSGSAGTGSYANPNIVGSGLNSGVVGTVLQSGSQPPNAPTNSQGAQLQVLIVRGALQRIPNSNYCGGDPLGFHAQGKVFCPQNYAASAVMVNCQQGQGGVELTTQILEDGSGGYVDCCVHESGNDWTYHDPVQVTCLLLH